MNNDATAPDALLLTPSQAAEALQISPRTLWQLAADGEISSVKIGRLRRYPAAELLAWIDTKKTGGPK